MKTRSIPPPRHWQELKAHPLADLIGFGLGVDVDALAEHMAAHGFDHDEGVVLFEGMVLDGRHRLAAAVKAGVVPSFRLFEGPDPVSYIAKKLFRQHLDESARALLAARIAKLAPSADAQGFSGPSLTPLASALNVSRRSATNAARVLEAGSDDLQAAVGDGTLTVTDAAQVAGLPAEQQDRAVAAVRGGLARTATAAVALSDTEDEPHDDELEQRWEPLEEPDAVAQEEQPAPDPKPGLCAKCRRTGRSWNCRNCAPSIATRPERGPGDDTDLERAEKERPKNGAILFEWPPLTHDFGALLRQVDKLGKAYGKKDSPEAEGLRRRLGEWKDDFKKWFKQLAKTNAPERA